jgi:hypothetical protein
MRGLYPRIHRKLKVSQGDGLPGLGASRLSPGNDEPFPSNKK